MRRSKEKKVFAHLTKTSLVISNLGDGFIRWLGRRSDNVDSVGPPAKSEILESNPFKHNQLIPPARAREGLCEE